MPSEKKPVLRLEMLTKEQGILFVKTLPGGEGQPKEQHLKSVARSHHDRRPPRAQRGCQGHTLPGGQNAAGGTEVALDTRQLSAGHKTGHT